MFGDDSNKKFVHFLLLLEIFSVIVSVNYCLFLEMKALSIQIYRTKTVSNISDLRRLLRFWDFEKFFLEIFKSKTCVLTVRTRRARKTTRTLHIVL